MHFVQLFFQICSKFKWVPHSFKRESLGEQEHSHIFFNAMMQIAHVSWHPKLRTETLKNVVGAKFYCLCWWQLACLNDGEDIKVLNGVNQLRLLYLCEKNCITQWELLAALGLLALLPLVALYTLLSSAACDNVISSGLDKIAYGSLLADPQPCRLDLALSNDGELLQ